MRSLLIFTLLAILTSCETKEEEKRDSFKTHFEISEGKETASYLQTIDFYIQLAKEFPEINIQTIGMTDSGAPLHMVTYNTDADFNFQKIGEEKVVILINNGIHPGESDGIDATMLLYRDLALEKLTPPKNTVLVTIPIYNVGGALNRNSTTRVNQNGPKSYGFRGNAKNYDLNRDFIKNDTKNAKTFAQIFHLVKPDIFIDNHVSNGADYQYTLTHLFTQHNKLGGELGQFLENEMRPQLEKSLSSAGWDITPYVNVFNKPPESGFSQFMDTPRYSTGYTTLWNTFGLMVETHMLKPYKKRVEGTYTLMAQVIAMTERNPKQIKDLRKKSLTRHRNWKYYPLKWELDTTKTSPLEFKGFEADTTMSAATGFPRLRYDRSRPFTKTIPYKNHYRASDSVEIPQAYIIKKGWDNIVDLMANNGVAFTILEQDTVLQVESYKIGSYQTAGSAYEGHYLHYDTEVTSKMEKKEFHAGDFLVPTDQPGFRYILETLEPQAVDSFFNWNFFDAILQRKEGFSPYVFEDIASNILEENTMLRNSFSIKKESDGEFASNWYAQLQWIYERSAHYESAHTQYPVYRILKNQELPITKAKN